MKKLAFFLFILSVSSVVHADEIKEKAFVCLTASFKADGTIQLVSDAGPQVIVLDNGTLTAYRLKDQFSLYNPMYNRNTPFNLNLVSRYGVSSPYTVTNDAVTEDWDMIASPKTSASLQVDLAKGTGMITTTATDSDGTTETDGKLVCTQAGVVGTAPAK